MRIARVLSFLLLYASTTQAQTLELVTSLRLTDPASSPRAAALGGVSVPLDSDTAGVTANAAAAANATRPMFAVSAASTSYDRAFIAREGATFFSYETRSTAVGVDSIVAAIPLGSFGIAGWYRDAPEIATGNPFLFRSPASSSPYPDAACVTGTDCGYGFLFGQSSASRRETRYGGAIAWRGGSLQLGVGAELIDLRERLETPRLIFRQPLDPGHDQLARQVSDRDVVLSAGVTWRTSPRLILAASFSEGPVFDRETTLCATEASAAPLACASETLVVDRSSMKLPHAIRAGAAFRVTGSLIFAAEAVHRSYGDLSPESYSLIGVPVDMPYHDATEFRAGVEYTIAAAKPLAVRAGWWRDPARVDAFDGATFAAARDVDHITLGAGIDFSGTTLDIAFDNAPRTSMRKVTLGLTHTF